MITIHFSVWKITFKLQDVAWIIVYVSSYIDCWLCHPQVFIAEMLRCLDPNKSNIVRYYESFHKIDRTFMVCELLDMSVHEYRSRNKWAPLPLNGIKIIIKDVRTQYHTKSWILSSIFPLWHLSHIVLLTSFAVGHSIKRLEGHWTDPHRFETGQRDASGSCATAI